MNQARFTAIAHRWHQFCSPVDPLRFANMLAQLPLQAGGRVLDVGCGNGAMLAWVAETWKVRGEGVEQNPYMLEVAQKHSSIRIIAGDATAVSLVPGYALALCVGSTHIFGDRTLEHLFPLVAPDGHVLIGQVYWKKPPTEAFLKQLGAPAGIFSDLSGTIGTGDRSGFTFLRAQTSTQAEWDAYEGLYHQSLEAWLRQNPEDPDYSVFQKRFYEVRSRYWEGGREHFGFVLMLYRRQP